MNSPSEGKDDWIPPVHDDDLPDNRYLALCEILNPESVGDFDIRELDSWLCSEASARQIDLPLHVTPELDGLDRKVTHSEKVKICAKIENASRYLADKLRLLELPPSLEQEIFADWAKGKIRGSAGNEWEETKFRVVSDLSAISLAAAGALARLQAQGGPRGKPPSVWRNITFSELARRLKLILPSRSKEQIASTAKDCWNIYFPHEEIPQDEAALQILQREARGAGAKT